MQLNYLTTQEDFDKAIEELKAIPRMCLDFETTGLDARVHKPRLLQLCSSSPDLEDPTVYVIDFFKVPDTSAVKDLILSREMLVIHNSNFDVQFLYALGIDYKGKVYDTLLAEKCIHAGAKERVTSVLTGKSVFKDISMSLKAVVARRFGEELDKEQQLSDWSKEDLDMEQLEYAALDVAILPKIAKEQLQELAQENLLEVYTLEYKIIRPVALMCHNGFNVDVSKLKKQKVAIQQKLDDLTKVFCESLDSRLPDEHKLPRRDDGSIAIGKKATKEFNPGSGVQCIKYFQILGTALPVNEESGKPTLSKVALGEFNSDDETLNLLRQRTVFKTHVQHIEKVLDNVNPVTGRVHSGYSSYGAASGRFTCHGAKKATSKAKQKLQWSINIQQVPKDQPELFGDNSLRSCFIPTPGFKFLIADYSQIELRIGAELIGITQMMEAFKKGEDLHDLTASLVFDIPIDSVSKIQRNIGKTLNFGLLYGMGFRKYKTQAANAKPTPIYLTLSEAKIAHAGFHRAYPRLRQWHRERADMVKDGWIYVRTPGGRRRLLSYDDCAMTTCCNTLIQGTGADILKLAIAKLSDHISSDFQPIASVHDELIFEVREGKEEQYKKILESCMHDAATEVLKEVPVKCDASVGKSWAEK